MTAGLATGMVEEMVKGKAMVALVLLVEETAGWIFLVVRAVVATVVVDGSYYRAYVTVNLRMVEEREDVEQRVVETRAQQAYGRPKLHEILFTFGNPAESRSERTESVREVFDVPPARRTRSPPARSRTAPEH